MTGKQILFFLDFEDAKEIVVKFEGLFDLKYFKAGSFLERERINYKSISLIPEIEESSAGDWNKDKRFVIIPNGQPLEVKNVPQRSGGINFIVDLSANHNSALIQLGGIYNNEVLVAGKFSIISIDSFSQNLFKSFSSILKKSTTRIGNFYVGNQALIKLRNGWRLVTNEKLSREYDLIP